MEKDRLAGSWSPPTSRARLHLDHPYQNDSTHPEDVEKLQDTMSYRAKEDRSVECKWELMVGESDGSEADQKDERLVHRPGALSPPRLRLSPRSPV